MQDYLDAIEQLRGFFLVVSFIMGSLVGSFANVCVSRWPQGLSVIKPRSRCPKCGYQIKWFDNIPILSWLMLGARCRGCRAPISFQYPMVEALTGFLFLAVYWRFGFVLATPVYMFLCAAMVIVTFQDLADWTIPNEITFPGIPLGFVIALVGALVGEESGLRVTSPLDALAGILLGGGILYALDRITVLVLKKPGMGFGDVKLLAMLGAFLGWQGVLGILMMASFLGSIVGIAMMLYFKAKGAPETAEQVEPKPEKKNADDYEDDDITLQGHYLPFGPYLALAGLLYMFFGPELVDAYVALLQPPVY